MSRKYRAGLRPRKSKKATFAIVLFISLLILGGFGGFIYWDTSRSSLSGEVSGVSRSVPQQEDQITPKQKVVDEPLYTFNLPPDWKETQRINSNTERSVTWQATKKNEDNRWLKLYVDTIPPDIAVNRLLPVDVAGNMLGYRQISDNCKNFTADDSDGKRPQPSKWQGVEFICDIPGFVQNKVGTGAAGAINTLSVTGPRQGEHKYFFLYTDHNIQPDYTILYKALDSFRAK